MCFPPSFQVLAAKTFEQGPETETPNYIAAIFRTELIHVGTTLYHPVTLIVPEEEGEYTIPIFAYERKTEVHKDKLVIEVTK